MNLFKNWYFLSKNLTVAERALEPAVAALGERYRSQWLFPRLYHIADFVLVDRRVIIEVDGASHKDPKQRYKDLTRTIALEQDGWKVVRCSNEEAIKSPFVTVADCIGHRVTTRPSLEELRTALGQLPPLPARKRATRRKSVTALPPKKGPRVRVRAQKAE